MAHHATEVAEILIRYIHDRQIRPGSPLPTQQQLSSELSIGIRRLRDGLNLLQEQGIVESRKKGGTIVRQPDITHLFHSIVRHLETKGYEEQDLITARALVESASIRLAASNRTTRDLLLMLSEIEKIEDLHTRKLPDEEADMDFHLSILKATHNPVLEVFGSLIVKVFFPKITGGFIAPEATRKQSNAEHRKIFDAIQEQDADTASQILYDHITAPLRGRKIR